MREVVVDVVRGDGGRCRRWVGDFAWCAGVAEAPAGGWVDADGARGAGVGGAAGALDGILPVRAIGLVTCAEGRDRGAGVVCWR